MKNFIIILIIFFNSFLYAQTDFLPISAIKPGMKGFGLTVFEGSKIDTFEVKIIEVMYNFYPGRDIILVKLLGDRTDHTGVVAGMSGSPIYIKDKLIGALAYRLGDFMKDAIAGITPIGEMFEIFQKEKKRAIESPNLNKQKSIYSKYYLEPQNQQKVDLLSLLANEPGVKFLKIKPIETPFVMTGLQPSLYQKLSERFEQMNLPLLPGGKLKPRLSFDEKKLVPGAAVGAVMVNGDFDISAVGTVTYRDGDKILAFGHPMLDAGPVNIPMAKATVITTLSSYWASNKLAVSTDIIGNIRQDRSPGIMGVLGEVPPMIPVRVTVKSKLHEEKVFNFNLADDPANYTRLPVFLWITLLNTLESARIANADYALKLTGSIKIKDSETVNFDNFYAGGASGFYGRAGYDMAEAAYDIAMTTGSILTNKFSPVKIEQLSLNFEAIPGQKSARIEKIYFNKKTVKPGEKLKVILHLKPYLGKIIEISKQIKIPNNVSSKTVTLAIGGKEEITGWEIKSGAVNYVPSDFSELVKILNRRRKNNGIYIQLKTKDTGAILHGKEFPTLPPSINRVMNNEKSQKTFKKLSEKIIKEWTIFTDYGITGGRRVNLKIRNGAKL
ncbi:hypothetical protein H8E88_33855 [candidate division KSB1 bacterium]|nr:hypothetical protein [candidate division KSB1 bacterium]MBL7093585.1 hypothetical protein [candidate division KSB1 bacterium]